MTAYLLRNWQLGVVGFLAISGLTSGADRTLAQITPDATLGDEGSVMTPNVNVKGLPADLIEGGATRGTNLFHSFSEFNIGNGQRVYFANPAGIENILSRVTGNNVSNILGTLGVDGGANLFLLNPNGIIFGQNASLDVGGSFVASTANSLVFDNGFEFSATNPQAPPLLTINVPLGLQTGANPGKIVNQSRANGVGLQVQSGRTLALVGGEMAIQGGILYAPDGRIELGSVADNNRVSLTPTSTGYTLSYEDVENFQDIRLTQEAGVDTSANSGGSIQVQGRNLVLTEGSQVVANTLGSGKGGGLSVNASESVQVLGRSADGSFGSGLFARAMQTATGEAGDLTITTRQLLIQDGAFVSASTTGAGKGGNLTVNASEEVLVIGESADGQFASTLSAQVNRNSTGDAGNVSITTSRLTISGGAQVSASTFGAGSGGNLTVNASEEVQVIGRSADGEFSSNISVQANPGATGDAGELNINTTRLTISGGAQVGANTAGAGRGGNLTVNASEEVQVLGRSADSRFGSSLSVSAEGTGDAGNLTITTSQLLIRDGAQVSAGTFGAGKGGNLIIDASDSVQLIGTSADGRRPSSLFAGTQQGTGDAGDISITTRQLLVRDGARVGVASLGAGKGGDLTVNASESVHVIGTSTDGRVLSGLFVNAEAGSTAGNLSVETGQMSVRDGAQVTVSSLQGQAGNLNITANSLSLNRGTILAETGKSTAEGGANITLQGLDLLRMDNESLISATALEDANGGNITIDSSLIVATPPQGLEGSDIIANASRGNGGRVNITTQGIFGLEYRPQRTPDNDITASSQFGISGTVNVNGLAVDPSRGLTNLPTEVVDVSNQIDQTCAAGGTVASKQSRFVVTGSGGLPDSPEEALSPDTVWEDLRLAENSKPSGAQQTVPFEALASSNNQPTTNNRQQTHVEAKGWAFNQKGEVVLTANEPTLTPPGSWQKPVACPH